MFAARERKTGYRGAIKVMDRSRIKATSINREYTVLEALGHHPSVVRYLGTYKTWATVSFAMERVTGGELFEHLIQTGAMTEEQARSTFVPVLRGLAYLHGGAGSGQAIVHRDLKPENLLLVPMQKAKRQRHRHRRKIKRWRRQVHRQRRAEQRAGQQAAQQPQMHTQFRGGDAGTPIVLDEGGPLISNRGGVTSGRVTSAGAAGISKRGGTTRRGRATARRPGAD